MRIFFGILVFFSFNLMAQTPAQYYTAPNYSVGTGSANTATQTQGPNSAQQRGDCPDGQRWEISTTSGRNSNGERYTEDTSKCVSDPNYNDAKNSCDTARKEYRDVVKDGPEKESDAAEKDEEKIQTAEKEAAAIQEEIDALKKEIITVEKEYNEKVLELQNLIREQKNAGDVELASLIKESQELVSQYESNLNEEREGIYNTYKDDLRQQYNQCQIDAQKLLAAMVEQGEQIRQARNSGALQYQSTTASMGRESNRNRIKREVQKFYVTCVDGAKTQNEASLKFEIAKKDSDAKKLLREIESKKQEIQRIIDRQSEDQRAKLQEANNARVAAENEIKKISENISEKQEVLQKSRYEGPLRRETAKTKSKLARDSALLVAKIEAWDACCIKDDSNKIMARPGASAGSLCKKSRPREPRESRGSG